MLINVRKIDSVILYSIDLYFLKSLIHTFFGGLDNINYIGLIDNENESVTGDLEAPDVFLSCVNDFWLIVIQFNTEKLFPIVKIYMIEVLAKSLK